MPTFRVVSDTGVGRSRRRRVARQAGERQKSVGSLRCGARIVLKG